MSLVDTAKSISMNVEINNRDLCLMTKDELVLVVNLDEGKFDIVRDKLLPFTLKGRLREVPSFESVTSKYEDIQRQVAIRKNQEAITSWLSNRVLLLSRTNAKWLYNALKLEQVQTETEKAKVALLCRAVSINDTYWVKLGSDTATWSDVNLRTNPLNEIIAQIALHGKSLTIQGSLTTPELTTHGAYAKAWRRHEDGSLWLYKKGHNGDMESRIEVMVSDLLDKMNIQHCHYEAGKDDGHYVCMCPAMSTEDKAILYGTDFISYCNVNGKNPDSEMLRIDKEMIYKMWVVDYLIANRDRHGQNWGFYYDSKTMEILSCHPLYDHNNAFDIEWMKDPDADYQFGNMTIRQAAHKAIREVDIKILNPITRDDFITERQYNCFMSRAKELGII